MKNRYKNRRKNSIYAIVYSICALVCCGLITVMTAGELHAQNERVVDTCGLFTESEAAALEQACLQFEQETGIRTAIFSVNTATVGGQSEDDSVAYIEAYADTLSGADFVGLLINMDIRYYYIDVTGDEALRIYTDSRKGQLGDDVAERLSKGEYAASAQVFLEKAAKQCAYARKNNSYGTIKEERKGFQPDIFGIAAVLAAVISGMTTGIRAKKHKERHVATEANRYIVPGTINLHRNRNVFVSQYVTRVPIPQEKDQGGGGGFTTTHTSSGGGTHSGHGGHF